MHRLRSAIPAAVSHSTIARCSRVVTTSTIKQQATRLSCAAAPASAATPPRRAHSTAPPPPPSPSPRLFGFPFGLDEHEGLIDQYRHALGSDITAAKDVIADLGRTLAAESHAFELEQALQGKCNKAPGSSSTESTVELASRTELWTADVQSIVADLTMEKVNKSWVIHAPTAAMSDASIAGVRFESSWTTSLHSIRRELAPYAFHAKLTATPYSIPEKEAADPKQGENSQAQENTAQDDHSIFKDHRTMVLLDVTEADRSRVDIDAMEVLRVSLAPSMTPRDFAWFLSFLASHPTDLAFDVFSEALVRGDKQQKQKNNNK